MCSSVRLVTLWVRPHLFCVSVRSFVDIVGASPPRRKLGKVLYMKDDLRIAGIHTGGCIHSPGLTTTVSFLVPLMIAYHFDMYETLSKEF